MIAKSARDGSLDRKLFRLSRDESLLELASKFPIEAPLGIKLFKALAGARCFCCSRSLPINAFRFVADSKRLLDGPQALIFIAAVAGIAGPGAGPALAFKAAVAGFSVDCCK